MMTLIDVFIVSASECARMCVSLCVKMSFVGTKRAESACNFSGFFMKMINFAIDRQFNAGSCHFAY